MVTAVPLRTSSTARPRSICPSGRKRNRPSTPSKPEGLVSTCSEKRAEPCCRASAATNVTAV